MGPGARDGLALRGRLRHAGASIRPRPRDLRSRSRPSCARPGLRAACPGGLERPGPRPDAWPAGTKPGVVTFLKPLQVAGSRYGKKRVSRVSSPGPGAGSLHASRNPSRHLRHHRVIGHADPGQNPSAVRSGSSRVRGEEPGQHRARSPADRRPDERQGATVPGLVCYREPRWEPSGRTNLRDFRAYINCGPGRGGGGGLI